MAKPTMVDEDNGDVRNFWSCPVRFIPDSVYAFLRYREYHEKHPSVPFPPLENLSPRYALAEAVFDAELSRCLSEGT